MNSSRNPPAICVDIGNSAIKFASCTSLTSNEWLATWQTRVSEFASGDGAQFANLTRDSHSWWICSVNNHGLSLLQDWIHRFRPEDNVFQLENSDVQLEIAPHPIDAIGTDRLVAAVGAVEHGTVEH